MKTKKIVIHARRDARLDDVDLSCDALNEHDVLIQTSASFISAGTELAVYTGLDPNVDKPDGWCRYPFPSGYANVGRIVAMGKAVENFTIGDRVFTLAHHTRDHIAVAGQNLVVPVPESLTDAQASSARMAMVAMAAISVADVALNEHVAVFGLGAVGNLAAQLFSLGGARVIGIDPSGARRELAERCGVWRTVGGTPQEVDEEIKRLTDGKGVRVAVDAVGDSRVVRQAADSAMKYGQVLLLGSPRESVEGDMTAVVWPVHYRAVSFIGANEWRLPLVHRPSHREDLRHSIESNLRTIYDLIERGRLKVDELVTHTMSPQQIGEAYEGLDQQKDQFWGVVLDWSSI